MATHVMSTALNDGMEYEMEWRAVYTPNSALLCVYFSKLREYIYHFISYMPSQPTLQKTIFTHQPNVSFLCLRSDDALGNNCHTTYPIRPP